jgi:glutathione peroxidase
MNVYDYSINKIDGSKVSLEDYKGKVLLIVNTATKCGFTPQYKGLEELYEKYKDHGFEIIDLPCNQFLNQAPENNNEIANFCQVNYGTQFETFAKIKVNGEDAHPLYKYLKEEKPKDVDNGEMAELQKKLKGKFSVDKSEIQWNFTKFLIDRQGNVVERYAPTIEPEKIKGKIEELL